MEYDFRPFYFVRPRIQTKDVTFDRTEQLFKKGFISVCFFTFSH